MQHGPQVLLLIHDLRSLRAVRFLGQREQQLKDGPHFLLHLSRAGEEAQSVNFIMKVLSYCHNTIGIAWRLLLYIWSKSANVSDVLMKSRPSLTINWVSMPHGLFMEITSWAMPNIYKVGGASITSSLFFNFLESNIAHGDTDLMISQQRYLKG